METSKTRYHISFNSPVILSFFFISLAALALSKITGEASNRLIFSVYRSSLADPLTYIRCFAHVFGHANWEHFIGNMTLFLVVGPMLEEKYGSMNLLFVILTTAFVTGLVYFIFFPDTQLLGASGVVFAFVLLSSFTSIKDGSIPVTFLLIAVIYIGGQIYDAITVQDNVSNLTHIIGGGVGSSLGFVMTKYKMSRYSA